MGVKVISGNDFHIGGTPWGFDRTCEEDEALETFVRTCFEQRPDLIVFPGDMSDAFRNPGNGCMGRISRLLGRLLDAPWKPQVLWVKGNHDWNGIEPWQHLSERLHIAMTPELRQYQFASGTLNVLAIPHVRPFESKDGLEAYLSRKGIDLDSLPGDCFVVAHLALEGTIPAIKETVIPTTFLHRFPRGGVMLGHIHDHGCLDVPGAECPVAYAGSLLRRSFGEEGSKLGFWSLEHNGSGMLFMDVPYDGKALHTLRFADEDEAAAMLPIMKEELHDVYVRIQIDQIRHGAENLIEESFRRLCPDLQIAKVVSSNEAVMETLIPELPEYEQSSDFTISMPSLWDSYVTSKSHDDAWKRIMKELGHAALEGVEPDEGLRLCEEAIAKSDALLHEFKQEEADSPDLLEGGVSHVSRPVF